MRHASLFSGIGCADLAAEVIGWENVFQVEIDKYCQFSLQKNFPNVKKYGDIKKFDGTRYRGTIDVLSGGFPCQKYSASGHRQGNEPLAQEMLRVVGEINPGFVVAENVYGFFSIDGGRSLEAFCTDLQNKGYEKPVVLDLTSDFAGLQTMERHLWIVSKANGVRCKGHGEKKVQGVGHIPRELPRAGARVGAGWDIRESRFFRVGQRTSVRLDKLGKHRLKAVGNAFPFQVAYEIFKAIETVSL